ncbi:MAG: hypothetical protein ABI467_00450 [Kofleriaceae bacterium]
MRLLWVVLGLAGCWTSSPPPIVEPPAPPPVVARHRRPLHSPCEATIDHIVEVMQDELARIPDFADKLDAIRDVAVASCNETEWTPELRACFDNTADNTAIQECQSLFTSDQTSDLMRRMTEVLTGLNAPPPVTP